MWGHRVLLLLQLLYLAVMVTIALQRPPIGAAWLGVPDWQTDTLITSAYP